MLGGAASNTENTCSGAQCTQTRAKKSQTEFVSSFLFSLGRERLLSFSSPTTQSLNSANESFPCIQFTFFSE